MRFLLDTNILSEAMRPRPDSTIVARLGEHGGACAIPAPVWHELVFGTARLPASRRKRELERYLCEVIQPRLPILPYDRRSAAWHATERARLAAAGRPPSYVDGQIAAIAAVNDLILVTRNQANFAFFMGLHVESWA